MFNNGLPHVTDRRERLVHCTDCYSCGHVRLFAGRWHDDDLNIRHIERERERGGGRDTICAVILLHSKRWSFSFVTMCHAISIFLSLCRWAGGHCMYWGCVSTRPVKYRKLTHIETDRFQYYYQYQYYVIVLHDAIKLESSCLLFVVWRVTGGGINIRSWIGISLKRNIEYEQVKGEQDVEKRAERVAWWRCLNIINGIMHIYRF